MSCLECPCACSRLANLAVSPDVRIDVRLGHSDTVYHPLVSTPASACLFVCMAVCLSVQYAGMSRDRQIVRDTAWLLACPCLSVSVYFCVLVDVVVV